MEQIKNTIRVNPHRPSRGRLVGLVSSLRIHRTSLRRRRHPHLAGLTMLASLIDSAIVANAVGIAIGAFVGDFAGTRSLGGLDALGCCLDDLVWSGVFGRRGDGDFWRFVLAEGAGALAFGSHGGRCVYVRSGVFVGASGGLAWGSRSLRLADFLRAWGSWRGGGGGDDYDVANRERERWEEKRFPMERETQERAKDGGCGFRGRN